MNKQIAKKQTSQSDVPNLPKDSLSFIPLGGCGEFGNNFHVLHYNGEYLLIDCGFGFADERFPGVDIVVPSPSFLPHVAKQIKGIVFTHAHEDHVGAIGALWPQLNCPVYATPLVARLLDHKFREWGLERRVTLNVVPLESRHKIGGFDVEWINTAHSVPETSMIFVRTPVCNLLHTADWRFDPAPVVGQVTNIERLKEIAAEGIDILIAESTNAGEEYELPSEQSLTDGLAREFEKASGKVVVSCMASRVARLHNVAMAARKAGRVVGLLGRSMWRFYEAAYDSGYMRDLPPFLKPKELADVPRNKLVVIATGSQGERGSALDRLARRDHNDLELYRHDTVIFSARQIPGNEKDILRMQGWITQQEVNLITPKDAPIHVSGHATAPDMRVLYKILQPKVLVTVHGDVLNQLTHAQLAKDCGIDVTITPKNGDVIVADRIEGAGIIDQVETGLMAIDGDRVVPITDSKLFKQRQKIGQEGHVVLTLILDEENDLVSEPVLVLQGVAGDAEEHDWVEGLVVKTVEQTLRQLDKKSDYHAEIWAETIRVALRHLLNDELGKKPVINVQLVRI
ncbi:MAG TPA: ribonuclease J [Alphaproteobacteria bacterium]